MSHYRCIRFHIEMDVDINEPPESDIVIRRMIRKAVDKVLKTRYSKARNVKILNRREIKYP